MREPATRAQRAPRRAEPKRPSFGQMACAFLLASPLSAMARMLAPPQNAGRNLLDACTTGPWSDAQGCGQTGLNRLDPSVQRVMLENSWCNVRDNSCSTGGKEYVPAHTLTYAFDSAVGPTSSMMPLLDATQAQVRQDLATLSLSINMTFREINAAPVGRANLLFFRARTPEAAIPNTPAWVGTSAATLVAPNVAGVFEMRYSSTTSERLSAIGVALGLTAKGQLGYNGTNGSPGKFFSNTMNSVSYLTENTCVNVDQFGPLDLAALATKYGVVNEGVAKTYDLRDGMGVAGLVTSVVADFNGQPTGNTLRATYSGSDPLQVSLESNGNSYTRVGSTYRTLGPGATMANADISRTLGGIVIGNNGTNYLTGSPYADVFRVGARLNYLTLGAGADSIILQYPGANVTVTDFTAQDTVYVPWLTDTSSVTAFATNPVGQVPGTGLLLPGATTVVLPGFKGFSLATNLKVGTNPPNNFLIQPCPLERSANWSAPPAPPAPVSTTHTPSGSGSGSSPNYNPCSNIGTPGLSGGADSCATSVNIPYLPVIWDP